MCTQYRIWSLAENSLPVWLLSLWDRQNHIGSVAWNPGSGERGDSPNKMYLAWAKVSFRPSKIWAWHCGLEKQRKSTKIYRFACNISKRFLYAYPSPQNWGWRTHLIDPSPGRCGASRLAWSFPPSIISPPPKKKNFDCRHYIGVVSTNWSRPTYVVSSEESNRSVRLDSQRYFTFDVRTDLTSFGVYDLHKHSA